MKLVIRKGKYGKFTACSNYPECKDIKKEERETKMYTLKEMQTGEQEKLSVDAIIERLKG